MPSPTKSDLQLMEFHTKLDEVARYIDELKTVDLGQSSESWNWSFRREYAGYVSRVGETLQILAALGELHHHMEIENADT